MYMHLYSLIQDIYVAPFGASDEAASLESTLKQDASFVLGPERSAPSSIVHGKSSSSGTVKGVGFVDADVCFWQLAKHQLHKADALSTRAVSNVGMCAPLDEFMRVVLDELWR